MDNQHGFLNISVTPIECSIVCHTSWAENVFQPALDRLPAAAAATVSVSPDSYTVFSVISGGMDAGSRVVDLTLPLALAAIPIFFITTYYCDFILVPARDRQSVVHALLARGFVLSEDQSSLKKSLGGALGSGSAGTPAAAAAAAATSTTPPLSPRGRPSGNGRECHHHLPRPTTAGELQARTFELLGGRGVVPSIEPGLQLVQCSGRETSGIHRGAGGRVQRGNGGGNGNGGGDGGAARRESWVDTVDTKLYTSVVSALVAQPRFLSVTLAEDDPPSLLLDRALLPLFGDSLVGDTEGVLVPVFLDLVNLSFEATGIVSGVAGKLVEEMQTRESVELSYLSTARAGAVILSSERAGRALEVLGPLLVRREAGPEEGEEGGGEEQRRKEEKMVEKIKEEKGFELDEKLA